MSNKQQTVVEKLETFLQTHCNPSVCNIEYSDYNIAFCEAKKEEAKQAQEYAAFCVACDRKKLPLLEFEGWIKLEGSNK
jgi:hypothetical protein